MEAEGEDGNYGDEDDDGDCDDDDNDIMMMIMVLMLGVQGNYHLSSLHHIYHCHCQYH